MTRLVLAAIGLLAVAAPRVAQEPRTAVLGDSIRVGDVVPVAIRLTLEPGQRVAWPDTLPLAGETLDNAAGVRERVDTLSDGRLQVTGVYAVTPWRTGTAALPEIAIDVVGRAEGTRTVTASLPALEVHSVLPADTVGIEPKPAKGVVGPSWAWESLLLAILALLALLGLLAWWLRRRARRAAAAPPETVHPRERALERLQEALDSGLIERGAWKPFYTRVGQAVRGYVAALDPTWGEDLTTTELLARLRLRLGPREAAELGDVLRPLDQVKFARRRPDAAAAREEWAAARRWVERFDGPRADAAGDREAAA